MADYEGKIIEAIETIVNSAVDNAGYDKTIQAQILSCVDKTIGKYKLKFQDSTFYAYAESAGINYTAGSNVYVLVPGNDWSNDKTILGAQIKLGDNYTNNPEGDEAFNLVGTNCIESTSEYGLHSYAKDKEEIVLYDRANNINKIKLSVKAAEQYIKDSNALLLGATLKTELPSEQRYSGNYGVCCDLVFSNNSDNGEVTRHYIIDVNHYTGSPYVFTEWTRQHDIFALDGKNFKRIQKIYLFCYGFPYSKDNPPVDIHIKELELYGCNQLSAEELQGSRLDIITPQGNFFDSADTSNRQVLQLQAKVRVNGKLVDPESQKLDYYWFVEDLRVAEGHPQYNNYGGCGWACLNETNTVDERVPLYEWVAADYIYEVHKKDALAKENKYKCVAVYGNTARTILQNEIIIANHDSNYDITIDSSTGETIFYYDVGHPDLITKVNGEGNIDKLNGYSFAWAFVDNNGNYQNLPLNATDNDAWNLEFQKWEKAIEEMQSKLEAKTALKTSTEKELNQKLTDIKKYDKIMRVDKNRLCDVQIDEITGFATFKCAVYAGNSYIGTGSITLVNKLEVEDVYTLVINNGAQAFQYDEEGVSPANSKLANPQLTLPLSFTIYDNYGRPLGNDIVAQQCEWEWKFPTEYTLLKFDDEIINKGTADKETYAIMTSLKSGMGNSSYLDLNFSIKNTYNIKHSQNTIYLQVKYNGMTLNATTDLTFVKVGEPGTNGTDFVCRIVAKKGNSIVRYPTLVQTQNNRGVQHNFDKLECSLWKEGQEVKDNYTCTWSILKNKYYTGVEDKTNLSVSGNGKTATVACNWSSISNTANIVQVKITYQNVDYYATIPIITSTLNNKDYEIFLDDTTGYSFVTYAADGRKPVYDSQNPFTMNVLKRINGVWEDISDTEVSGQKVTYTWGIKGSVWNKASTTSNYSENTRTLLTHDSSKKIYQHEFKPADSYDGECVTVAATCQISVGGSNVTTLHIPIHFMLNRYGQAALNDWDGNHIQIDQDGGFILSPQVGAGKKNNQNQFTGMLMGCVKEANHAREDIGLMGYANGVRTVFVNAEDGSAIFGKHKLGASGGQIIIDPSSTAAMIYTSTFFKSYNEDGKPTGSYYNYNDTTHKYTNQNYTDDKNNDQSTGSGMLIDFTAPRIIWGNRNFRVEPNGFLYAKGGGQIAGWKINDYRIDSVDNGEGSDKTGNTGMSSVYSLKDKNGNTMPGVTKWSVRIPKTATNTTGLEDKAMAFWAGGTGTDSSKFHVSHDGYLRVQEATIGSGKTGNLIYIGKSGDNSAIYTFNKNTFNASDNGFYLGTDGIAIGKHVSADGHSQFQVDNQGNFVARHGYIGNGKKGWTVEDTKLYNGKDSLNAATQGVYIGTDGISLGYNSDGDTPFYVKKDGTLHAILGTIGGWSLAKHKIYAVDNGNGTCTLGDPTQTYAFQAINKDGADNGEFWVKYNGEFKANKGTIGGWIVEKDKIRSPNSNIILNSDGSASFAGGKMKVSSDGKLTIKTGGITFDSTQTVQEIEKLKGQTAELSSKLEVLSGTDKTTIGTGTITASGQIKGGSGNFGSLTVGGKTGIGLSTWVMTGWKNDFAVAAVATAERCYNAYLNPSDKDEIICNMLDVIIGISLCFSVTFTGKNLEFTGGILTKTEDTEATLKWGPFTVSISNTTYSSVS